MSRLTALLPVAALLVLAGGAVWTSRARLDVTLAAASLAVIAVAYVGSGRRRGGPTS